MKKILSLALVCVMLVGMLCTLASCGTMLSGKYELATTTYEFKGNKYTKTTETLIGNVVESGTYKITGEEGDREITFTYEQDGEEKTETYDFSQAEKEGQKYITIGFFSYNKVED